MGDTDKTLQDFGRSTLALAILLHEDVELSETQTLFLDNHLQLLQLGYLQWKRHRDKPNKSDK
jgi:hypothetical protein